MDRRKKLKLKSGRNAKSSRKHRVQKRASSAQLYNFRHRPMYNMSSKRTLSNLPRTVTIPSRYETILPSRNDKVENRAFDSTSPRFKASKVPPFREEKTLPLSTPMRRVRIYRNRHRTFPIRILKNDLHIIHRIRSLDIAEDS